MSSVFEEVNSSCSWFQAWTSFPFIQQFLALLIVTPSVLDAGATGEVRLCPGGDRQRSQLLSQGCYRSVCQLPCGPRTVQGGGGGSCRLRVEART